MSRIYVVTHTESKDQQFVRANTLTGAIRAVANQTFSAKAATTEEMYQAFKLGLTVIDAVKEEPENE
jgi:hypothetical protein